MIRTCARTLLAVLALAGAAFPAMAAPADGPRSLDKKDIEDWAEKQFDLEGWKYVVSGEEGPLFMKREDPQLADWPVMRTWYRAEYFPKWAKRGSALRYLEVDCALQRTKILSIHAYPKADLKGEADRMAPAEEPDWVYPIPGSVGRDVLSYACLIGRIMRAQEKAG